MKNTNSTFAFLLVTFLICACQQGPPSPRFNHVYLAVNDLEQSVDFYTKAFDVEVTKRITKLMRTAADGTRAEVKVNMAFLKFEGQGFVLELSERPEMKANNTTASFAHLGIDVADITLAAQRLKDAGSRLMSPVALVEADGIVAKNTFYEGPDGEVLELMEIIEGEF